MCSHCYEGIWIRATGMKLRDWNRYVSLLKPKVAVTVHEQDETVQKLTIPASPIFAIQQEIAAARDLAHQAEWAERFRKLQAGKE